ncbi:hypothetical protein J2T12_002325 [Paenibacillus anaericanus]|uniref:hypothetical protein n=1 Tax=Paenibacillus anaericanus TaxID=170367 RepID=UPI00277F8B04|nr:hypothetical protein [Paenibacillus anaericanus]MDQ0088915.1 hypothetical protein [Paenibacillus anaericanus]
MAVAPLFHSEKRIEALLRRSKPNYSRQVWVYEDTIVELIEHSGRVPSSDQTLDSL